MNKIIESRIGNNIRLLREKSGITQEQLAAKLQVNGCDITRSAVAKIEVGQRHMYPDEIMLIKNILERVHIKSLCGFSSIILVRTRKKFEGILSYCKNF